MGFESFEVTWNRHIKILLKGVNDAGDSYKPSITAYCYPHFTSGVIKAENDIVGSVSGLIQGGWNYISCSSDLTNGYFVINEGANTEQTSSRIEAFSTALTSLSLIAAPNANVNFGVLFLKELKLWSRFDLWNYYTNCK